ALPISQKTSAHPPVSGRRRSVGFCRHPPVDLGTSGPASPLLDGHTAQMTETALSAVDVIVAKRDGRRLTDDQIDWMIEAYTRQEVADEQMSALLMAILLNGMDRDEIGRWTAAMIRSGIRMDLSAVGRPTVDKHSTGGVGDKISLPLA